MGGMPPVTPSPRSGGAPGTRAAGGGGPGPSAAAGAAPRLWRVRRLGTPREALRLEAAPARPPGPGEARVEVGAGGLNFPDLLLCAGRDQERPALPFSPGFEAAGIVAEAGDGAAVAAGQ